MSIYRRLLTQHGLTQSMSRKGSYLDNAAMERFFGTLKLNKLASIEQLQKGLRCYIRYITNNGLSPVQFRTQPLP
jgi:transposase InsO family protein